VIDSLRLFSFLQSAVHKTVIKCALWCALWRGHNTSRLTRRIRGARLELSIKETLQRMRHSDIRQAAREARATQRRRVWAAAALALMVVGLILVFGHYSHFSPSPAFASCSVALALGLVPLAALVDLAHSGRIQGLTRARAKLGEQLEASAARTAEALFLAATRFDAARRREPPPPPGVRARQIASLTLTPHLLAQRPQAACAIRAG